MAEIQDDRTAEQRATHTEIIGGVDRFMSGWGKATGGKSWAGWACKPEHADRVLAWVENRKDIRFIGNHKRVWRPRGEGHCHIYVVEDGHPAIS